MTCLEDLQTSVLARKATRHCSHAIIVKHSRVSLEEGVDELHLREKMQQLKGVLWGPWPGKSASSSQSRDSRPCVMFVAWPRLKTKKAKGGNRSNTFGLRPLHRFTRKSDTVEVNCLALYASRRFEQRTSRKQLLALAPEPGSVSFLRHHLQRGMRKHLWSQADTDNIQQIHILGALQE